MSEPENFFEVRHARSERMLREIADKIKPLLAPGYGFGLFLFEFGEGGNMFWVSNAQREDMIKSLREWIAKNQ